MKKNYTLITLLIFFAFQSIKAQVPADTIGAGNCLQFLGIQKNHVEMGNPYPHLVFPFTIQAWVYPYTIPTNLDGGIFETNNDTNAYWGAWISQWPGGTLDVSFGDTLGAARQNRRGFITVNIMPLDEWTQITVICYSETDVTMYFNGVLQSIEPDDGTTSNTTLYTSPHGHTNIGEQWNIGEYDPFNGQIDEVRFWNIALSQTQIQQEMCQKINGNTPGLVGYWRADEADTGSTVKDFSPTDANGKIVGTVNRLTSDAPVGNSSNYLYTSNFNGQSVKCGAANGDTLITNLVTGSPDGVQIYAVNSIPFFTQDLKPIPSTYFGVFCVNGTYPTYQVIYNYKLPDGFITVANQDSAAASNRLEATDTPWTPLNGTLNLGQQTITQTNQAAGRQEYILSLAAIDTAQKPCTSPNIVNNPGFENHTGVWPWETNQLNLCQGWSNRNGYYGGNVCGSPDWLSTNGSGYAQIPYWVLNYINPHSGSCISDICTYDGGQTDYREYIGTFFTTPMVVGVTYTVSFWVTSGEDQESEFNSNNFGALFSMDSATNCTYPINRTPQVNITTVIDTPDWVQYSFQYTADSAYRYITFGNFFTDANTTKILTVNGGQPYVVTFLDDISVTTTSGTIATSVTPPNDTICAGESVTLMAAGGTTYLWNDNATTDSIIVSPTTNSTYSVTVTSGSCSATDTARIEVNVAPPITIEPQNPIICSYQSILLTVPASGSNYQWSPSAGLSATTGDSVIATPTINVTYTVTGIDSLGCQVSATDAINLIPAPNIPTITVSVTGDSLISSAKSYNQWYFNDVLMPGDTGRYLVIKGHAKGWYSVTVTNPANGCSTTSDSTTAVNQLSVTSEQLSIYPNPTSSSVFVRIKSSVTDINDWTMQLTDVLGRTLYANSSLNYINEIDMSNFAAGVYFITIINKTDRSVFKVMKQ